MSVIRYKSRPITPVEAVQWNGVNFAEVQVVCPQVTRSGTSTMLLIPMPEGTAEVYVGEMVMRSLGGGEFSKMESSVFSALYEVQLL